MKYLIRSFLQIYFGKHTKKLLNLLVNIQRDNKLNLIDIGAAGGLEPRWKSIRKLLKCYLFEPDERSRSLLNIADGDIIINAALSDRATNGTFNLCRRGQVSSIYKPNTDFINLFPDANRFDIISSEAISFNNLDNIIDVDNHDIDFIKLDVQGAEVNILKGADKVLSGHVIGLEVEVEFHPIYQDQPLFGDISELLKSKGYEFFDFTNLCRWERNQFTTYGQCVFGDALFMKSPENFSALLSSLPESTAKKKAINYITICALYDRIDLLQVCRHEFKEFIDDASIKILLELQILLDKRRRKNNFVIKTANRILQYSGFRLIPIQMR